METDATSSNLLPTAPPIIFGLPPTVSSNSTPTSPSHSSSESSVSSTTDIPTVNSHIVSSPPNLSALSSTVHHNHSKSGDNYDPLRSPDWDLAGPPGILCSHRVKKDLNSIFLDPLPGIFIIPNEENLFTIQSLIAGPFDTPYEGGFFYFVIRFGPQYPLHPPRVRLMTTGHGKVRFNPNLYKCGKVCLSILGTWSGPAWSPASNLSSVLLSLQSLLNEKPYHNEPGYEEARQPGDVEKYNHIIMHETIRVSVLEQLTDPSVPEDLHLLMKSLFLDYYDHYVDICKSNLEYDGLAMVDPFGEQRGMYQFGTMLKSLEKLRNVILAGGKPSMPNSNPPDNSRTETADEGEASSVSLSDGNPNLSDDEDDDAVDKEEEEEEEEEETEILSEGASGSESVTGSKGAEE